MAVRRESKPGSATFQKVGMSTDGNDRRQTVDPLLEAHSCFPKTGRERISASLRRHWSGERSYEIEQTMTENSEKMLLKDRKRADIVAAAVNEFQTNGFAGTSMDRIAETADVSKRTVYNHFPSKEDLFQAIVNELVARCGGIDVAYDAECPLDEQLTAMGRQYVGIMVSDDFTKLARVVLSRFIHSPELAGSTVRGQDESKEAVVRWIQAAKKDGRLKVSNVQHAATQFASLLKAFAFWPQLIGNQEKPTKRELTQIVKSAVSMFLDHYGTECNP